MNKSIFIALLVLPSISSAVEVDTRTIADLKFAVNTHALTGQQLQLNLTPEISVYFDNDLKLTATGRVSVETFGGLQPQDMMREAYSSHSSTISIGEQSEFELRELYIEKAIGNHYLTLGKQQVVWGKADGLKVLDVVNPQSFKEFILEDFEDSRIPLWTVNYEWQVSDDASLQFLWIPDTTTHLIPKQGQTYAFTTSRLVPQAPQGVAVDLKSLNRPSSSVSDSDFGIRWSAFVGGWDLTLNYLYHYDDTPIFYQTFAMTPTGPVVTVDPEFKRSHLLGGTFSNAFGNLTVRGELGYSTDKYLLTTDVADIDGVTKAEELSYVLGLDWFGFDETVLSFQFFQSVVMDAPDDITKPEADTTVTFLAQREYLNDTLVAEILFLHNLNDSDGLIRPKISYEVGDDVIAWLGLDIFNGDSDGLFGEFKHNDRFLIGLELGF